MIVNINSRINKLNSLTSYLFKNYSAKSIFVFNSRLLSTINKYFTISSKINLE